MAYLSEAPAVTIEETTGQRRSVTLRGRALPYQGVAFGGTMRVATTWYPGNPVATMQVLGPELAATTMEGMWKDRFLPGQVVLAGFADLDGLETADAVVRAMEHLRDAGNELRVQWNNVVRRGVLTDFTPTWVRPQDVNWSATWTWFAANADQAVRAGYNPLPATTLSTALVKHDDSILFVPPAVSRDFAAEILTRANAVRAQVGALFDVLRQAQSMATMPLTLAQAGLTAVESLTAELQDEIGRMTNIPSIYASTLDRVVDVLNVEGWRRDGARMAAILRGNGQRTAAEIQRNVIPGILDVVTADGLVTLRQYAQTYYGSPDSWTLIANANGLVESTPAAGAIIIIPTNPAPAGTPRGRA